MHKVQKCRYTKKALFKSTLPEIQRIEHLSSQKVTDYFRVKTLAEIPDRAPSSKRFPLLAFSFGPEDPTLPVLGLVGGVHGLERVGTHVVLTYLESLVQRLSWDEELRRRFERVRLVALPLLNPAGMAHLRRSNLNGVDLMRNAPIDADPGFVPIAGGHRLGKYLPWYRGEAGRPMETEAQTLCDWVRAEIFPSRSALTIDFHSGFGLVDRLWHPYAKSKKPFPSIREASRIAEIFRRTYPHHVYRVEAQSIAYTTHGDLWDYLYDEHGQKNGLFLPWTLEMGSWQWIRKNPRQILSALGAFNPVLPHRYGRIMRRHVLMIDFFLGMAANPQAWGSSTS